MKFKTRKREREETTTLKSLNGNGNKKETDFSLKIIIRSIFLLMPSENTDTDKLNQQQRVRKR